MSPEQKVHTANAVKAFHAHRGTGETETKRMPRMAFICVSIILFPVAIAIVAMASLLQLILDTVNPSKSLLCR